MRAYCHLLLLQKQVNGNEKNHVFKNGGIFNNFALSPSHVTKPILLYTLSKLCLSLKPQNI